MRRSIKPVATTFSPLLAGLAVRLAVVLLLIGLLWLAVGWALR